jgi:small-conductance mechanosensitive channel
VSEDPVLAALARLEERVNALAQDQAMLFDAIRTVLTRLDELQVTFSPTQARVDRLDQLLHALGLEVRDRADQREPDGRAA